MRHLTWNEYVGEEKGIGLCCCCKKIQISQQNFHCGHFISQKNGGESIVENLRPICSGCNLSMGSKNMDDFMIECGFIKLEEMPKVKKMPQKIICGICNKELKSKQSLQYHESHNACTERAHQCEYCDKFFTDESNMYRHVRSSCKAKIKIDRQKELCASERINKNTIVVSGVDDMILFGYKQGNLSVISGVDLIKNLQCETSRAKVPSIKSVKNAT